MLSETCDKDVCFCFVVHNEVQLSKKLISNLRNFYPSSDVICITDGVSYSELKNFCNQKGIFYIRGEHLFNQKCGGLWLKRLLLK